MWAPRILYCLAVLGALVGPALVIGAGERVWAVAVDEKPLDDPAKEAEARDIMRGIRCLVCQNQSIEDSNADLARDLRQVVRERVAAGDDPDQVKAYLVARYGDWILLRPPFSVGTLVLWLGPFLLLVAGGALLAMAARRRRAAAAAEPPALSAEEKARLKKIEKELAR